ncbi:hypothetical protein M3484_12060 [Pseudomonas sp. GX19020]|uniref:hypothetical protein n=1 Tax=Pseudomonadota TaxID=1224 RepID=UPI00089ADA58|nr:MULTISPECIES: hypothetical protein [Pseudomonadota]MCL4067306.1 hypothetical protein [Pseudomonas sp. GX19020]SEC06256.1 hypothetical protein SAMN05519105_1873 [Rhodobacter sp. 24-YEA-8]
MKLARGVSGIALSALLALAQVVPALAYSSEILFQHKHWKVDIHGWDDGEVGCRAVVGDDKESFAIWIFQDAMIQLQFFSTSWDFGTEGQVADLRVQIDKREGWDLTAASLKQNSVSFNLPDSDAAVSFVMEIAGGNKLFLRSKDGKDVQNYSLSGSKASITSLLECGDAITGKSAPPAPSNPFQ